MSSGQCWEPGLTRAGNESGLGRKEGKRRPGLHHSLHLNGLPGRDESCCCLPWVPAGPCTVPSSSQCPARSSAVLQGFVPLEELTHHPTPLPSPLLQRGGWDGCTVPHRTDMLCPFLCDPSELLLPGGPTQAMQCQQLFHAHVCACGHPVHSGISADTEICAQAPPAPCPPPTPSIAHLQGMQSTAGAARAVPSPRGLGVNLCWWKWFSGQKNEKCCLGLNLDPHHPQELQCCVGGTELLGGSCSSAG